MPRIVHLTVGGPQNAGSPDDRDGTSQQARALAALAPASATIDERGHGDLLRFLVRFASRLPFIDAVEGRTGQPAGTWKSFLVRDDLSESDAIAELTAYMADPDRFDGERARWLGRPHLALLLAFLELLGHARAQLNGLTQRHLDFYYREVLRMVAEPPEPDRVAVVVRLAARVQKHRLPAGTALQAGRDSQGVPRIYRTERDLLVTRARVVDLRSVYVDRRVLGLADIRHDPRYTTGEEVFDGMLLLALGGPADIVVKRGEQKINLRFFISRKPFLDFTSAQLFLEHHELRRLLRLHRGRQTAGPDVWAEINLRLGLQAAPNAQTLAQLAGAIDFTTIELPLVSSLDDLYDQRERNAVRDYIGERFPVLGFELFTKIMAVKRRIDREWTAINELLERAGRRRRRSEAWELDPGAPTDFAANLRAALGKPFPGMIGLANIHAYDDALRQLERDLSMTAEHLTWLAAFATSLDQNVDWRSLAWAEVDRLLADAHREKVLAYRRGKLAAARNNLDGKAGFLATVRAALPVSSRGKGDAFTWDQAEPILRAHLDGGQLGLLMRFREQLDTPSIPQLVTWDVVDRILELACRWDEGLPEPVAQRVEWHNLHAFADATAQRSDPASPRWKTFGRPPRPEDMARRPDTSLGWGLCSPLLALSQGTRTLTLTFGLKELGRAVFERDLGVSPARQLGVALAEALCVEVSTAKGWACLALQPDSATLASGGTDPGCTNYGSLTGLPEGNNAAQPALRFMVTAGTTVEPFAPLPGSADPWPTLRVTLEQRYDPKTKEWLTTLPPFVPLVLVAVHLRVQVEGLTALQLQHEARALDPHGPFQPFGNRPAVGARLYLSHPELARARLDRLRFDIEWMGRPADLDDHYQKYTQPRKTADFKTRVALVDSCLELELASAAQLFGKGPSSATIDLGPAQIKDALGGFKYAHRPEVSSGRDLRTSPRHFFWELAPKDFGHAEFPTLVGAGPPYTPTIKRLSVAYETSDEFDATRLNSGLRHVHPFGHTPIDPGDPRDPRPTLVPRYEAAGELYIGLAEVDAPEPISLLFQLAEGTSDPVRESAPIEWSVLDGERWTSLAGRVLHDSTRGFSNSGIVELALPAVAPSTRLPAGRTWLRAAIARDPGGVCDALDVRAQAVMLRFDDRGNAPDHYRRPLPNGSVDRLLKTDARIAAIEQPYTSFGGRPPEDPERFYTRVSERLRHKQRALTPWDHERLVLQRFAEIFKVKCIPASSTSASDRAGLGEPGRVDVIVVPDVRRKLPADAFAPRAPADLLADIQAYLAERSPSSARVVVRNADYVPVRVRLAVRFRPGADERCCQQQLSADLTRFLSPWAYDDGAELMLGGKIYASSILDFVDRRDYVDYVGGLKLFFDGDPPKLIPSAASGYAAATTAPDQVLVSARQHDIDVIRELDYQQSLFTGINYMKLELDFIVG